MTWYRTGTVTVTNGQAIVTGAGTDFVANVLPGDGFLGADGRAYEVRSIQSATQLTLMTPWMGATGGGQAFQLQPTQSHEGDLAIRAGDLLLTFGAVRDGIGQGLIADGSPATPGVRFAADQDTGIRRTGDNGFALVAGGVDQLLIGGDGIVFPRLVRSDLALSGAGSRALTILSTTAGATDVQLAIVTPDRQWNVGQNVGGTGQGALVIFDVTAGRPRMVFDTGGRVRPGGDNIQELGAAAYRWSVVFAGTGTINTSDARLKQDVGAVPDEWLDAWGDVTWSRWRFREAVAEKADGARWHLGLVAQQVRDVFAAHGIDATAIGLLCHDAWPETPATPHVPAMRDADGREIAPARPARPAIPAGDRWGLRYDECQAIEAAWQRRRIAQLEARLEAMA